MQFEYDEEADLIRHYDADGNETNAHRPSACERYLLVQIQSLEYKVGKLQSSSD